MEKMVDLMMENVSFFVILKIFFNANGIDIFPDKKEKYSYVLSRRTKVLDNLIWKDGY